MGDSWNATACAGIKIGVEHACRANELQLGPVTFAHLEVRLPEMLPKLVRGHSVQGRMIVAAGGDGRGRKLRLGLHGRGRSASRDKQGGERDEETHRPFVAAGASAGKLAATGKRG